MSTFEIKMPKLGESITEGTIISWSVKVGDVINEDDVLLEVNTAKVSAEIPSPVAGRVLEILFEEGDTVAVGTVVALVALEAVAVTAETAAEAAPTAAVPAETASSSAQPPLQPQTSQPEAPRWLSPAVLQLARAANLPAEALQALPGTGYQGRLSKKDLQQYIALQQSRGRDAQPEQFPANYRTADAQPEQFPANYRTDGGAAMQSRGSGNSPRGQETTSAPLRGISDAQQVVSGTKQGISDAQQAISGAPQGDVEVKEMDRVRRLIADHMVMSKHTSPHVTTLVEVDVTRLVKWREAHKADFMQRHGVKLTYMPAITEATARALAAYPQVNVSVEGYNILYKKRINVGIAVSQDDGNLIVPVVHDADRLNLGGLAIAINSLASKARIGRLAADDISGGTFTITNFGTFGSLFGTPIINQPQVAILGVGAIEKKPAVMETPEGDVIAIRHKMYLSLSYDHRVVDGALGGRFLYFVKEYLEGWEAV